MSQATSTRAEKLSFEAAAADEVNAACVPGKGFFQHLVYGLVDPTTGELRYVGKSSQGLYRPSQHTGNVRPTTKRGTTHLSHWLDQLRSAGRKPAIIVLKALPDCRAALACEVELVRLFRQCGFALVNQTDGGQGSTGRPVSEKTRKAVSEAARRRVYTPELLQKLKETHAHVKPPEMTPERRARMIAKLTGRKVDPEVLARRKATVAALWADPDYRKRRSAEISARIRSRMAEDPEFKERISAGLIYGRQRRRQEKIAADKLEERA